jgi:hypothetical protein
MYVPPIKPAKVPAKVFALLILEDPATEVTGSNKELLGELRSGTAVNSATLKEVGSGKFVVSFVKIELRNS